MDIDRAYLAGLDYVPDEDLGEGCGTAKLIITDHPSTITVQASWKFAQVTDDYPFGWIDRRTVLVHDNDLAYLVEAVAVRGSHTQLTVTRLKRNVMALSEKDFGFWVREYAIEHLRAQVEQERELS